MKKALSIVAMLALSGCASFHQAVAGYGKSAVQGAQAANDNIIDAWKVAACATPLSSAVRNPEVIPALKVLCPGVAASGLFDSVPK